MAIDDVRLEESVAVVPGSLAGPGASRSTSRGRSRLGVSLVVALDVAAVLVGLALTGPLSPAILLYGTGVILTLWVLGEYRMRITLSVLADAPRLVGRLLIPSVILLITPYGGDQPYRAINRVLAVLVAVLVARAVSYAVLRLVRRRRLIAEPTVVVGAGSIGIELAGLLDQHPECGLSVVGFVDDVPSLGGPPLLASLGELEDVLAEMEVARLIVAFTPSRDESLVRVLRAANRHDVQVHIVPRFFELGLAPTGPDVDQVWGIPLYRVKRAALRGAVYRVKRGGDVVLSGLALLLLSPLIGLIALLVKRSSHGPVLFRQVRIGQNGDPIEVLKFRTMEVNDDSDVTWAVGADERVTGVGRWLRRLSLDELPQLWNVFRGDMSLVGPRPERPYYVNRFCTVIPGYGDRHRLPVGLTGLAQVHGLRGDTSIRERARFDNAYVEHWSPWLDVQIMVRTVGSVLEQAHRGEE